MRVKHPTSGGREFQAEESDRVNSLRQKCAEVFLVIDKDANVVRTELTSENVREGSIRELDHGGHFRTMKIFYSE